MNSSSSQADNGLSVITHLLKDCKAKSDTEKFVAMSFLQNLLDSDSKLREDHVAMTSIWHLMPHSFLSRLLRSRPSPNVDSGNSQNMNHLAIGIIQAFANLLPQDELNNNQGKRYVTPLIETIPITSNPQRALGYHALQCLVSTSVGAGAFLQSSLASKCFAQAIQEDDTNLESIVKTLRACRAVTDLSTAQEQAWDDLVTSLIPNVKDNPGLMLDMLTEHINRCPIENEPLPDWVPIMVETMKVSIIGKASLSTRTSSVMFAGALLQHSPPSCDIPSLLFWPQSSSDSTLAFTNIFVKLLLVDIRATIPGLMVTLMEPSYPTTALRLAMSYELLTAFLSLLMRSLDEDDDMSSTPTQKLALEPDAILQLRHDLSETLSYTLEYFRDRWDASFAGAAGLHASARAPTREFSSAPLQLGWDNSMLSPAKDPITLSGLRCLALWICEDDNPDVQELTVGVMDMLVSLYSSSTEPDSNDLRHPILTALSGLFPESPDAVEAFLQQDGWSVLAKDLQHSLPPNTVESHVEELLRVLNLVVTADADTVSKEAWMQLITATAQIELPTNIHNGNSLMLLDDLAAAYQLVLSLYQKAPSRLKRLYKADLERVQQRALSVQSLLQESTEPTPRLKAELEFIIGNLAVSLKS